MISRISFFTLLFFLLAEKTHAGEEKMNSRINAAQISPGGFVVVTDNKYGNLTMSGTAIIKSSVGRVTLALDNYATTLNYFTNPSFYFTVKVNITYFNSTGVQTSMTKFLTIDRQAAGSSREKHDIVIKDAHAIAVQIIEVFDINGDPYVVPLPNNLFLEAEITTERFYQFSTSAQPVANHYFLSASNELEVYWNTLEGAEEYELEYTFVNNYDSDANGAAAYEYNTSTSAVIPAVANSGLTFSFNNNATRIRTRLNKFKISLNFERG